MQNNRQKFGLALILLGLIIIIVIVYLLIINRDREAPPILEPGPSLDGQLPSDPETMGTTPADRPLAPIYDPSREPARQVDAEDLSKRAMLYVERLGSYSSQSDYSNFLDLKIYMTAAMRTWVDRRVAELKDANQGLDYYGIETKALTTQINNFSEEAGTAEIRVVTERRESRDFIGGGEPFRQSVTLNFRKVAADWLIDGVYWE